MTRHAHKKAAHAPARSTVTLATVVDTVNHGLASVHQACRTATLNTAKAVASQIDEVAVKVGARCVNPQGHPDLTVMLNTDHVAALDVARLQHPQLYQALQTTARHAHKKLVALKTTHVAAYLKEAGTKLLHVRQGARSDADKP